MANYPARLSLGRGRTHKHTSTHKATPSQGECVNVTQSAVRMQCQLVFHCTTILYWLLSNVGKNEQIPVDLSFGVNVDAKLRLILAEKVKIFFRSLPCIRWQKNALEKWNTLQKLKRKQNISVCSPLAGPQPQLCYIYGTARKYLEEVSDQGGLMPVNQTRSIFPVCGLHDMFSVYNVWHVKVE